MDRGEARGGGIFDTTCTVVHHPFIMQSYNIRFLGSIPTRNEASTTWFQPALLLHFDADDDKRMMVLYLLSCASGSAQLHHGSCG